MPPDRRRPATISAVPGRPGTISCVRCGSRLRRGNPGPLCDPCARSASAPVPPPDRAGAGRGGGIAGLPAGFVVDADLAAAVRDLDFGPVFRAVRAHLGLSQEALGRALDLDQSRICKVENGVQRLRDVEVVARVCRVLGIPAELLGFLPADGTGAVEGDTAMESNRREFLALVAAMVLDVDGEAVPGGIPAPAVAPAPLTTVALADVRRIEDTTQAFCDWGFRWGAALSRSALAAQLGAVRATARTASCRDEAVRRRLLVATGDLAQVTAWSSYDAEAHAEARQFWLVALEAARAAGEPDLVAQVLWGLAHQAINLAQPGPAGQYLRLAHAAVSDVRWQPCPALLAGLAAAEARVHAMTGQQAACRRALALSTEHLAGAAPDRLPPWRRYFDAAELTSMHGHCLHALAEHRPEVAAEAHDLLVAAVAGRTAAAARSAALDLAACAATCFQAGDDVPGGIRTARRALAAVDGIDAPRIRTRARVLLAATGRYATRPEVAELRRDLVTVLGPPPAGSGRG